MRSRSMESGLRDCQEHWHKSVERVQSGSDLCSERSTNKIGTAQSYSE